ncbi:MAG: hypothetical protein NC405_05825 [Odoribacter sp.]|nr:hypothetical protein [Odoribacter sp.]
MKILLLGDYSNFHPALGAALARQGHDVTVASDGCSWMDTRRAIDLSRKVKGPFGGALLFSKMLTTRQLSGYDVVSLINPSFVTLKPSRLKIIFDRLLRHNGKVFLNACGTDKAYMDMLTATDCPLTYSEYTNPDGSRNEFTSEFLAADRLWQQGAIADFCEYVYDRVAGVTTALYEYDLAMRRRFPDHMVAYSGIPVDLASVKPLERPLAIGECISLFLGRDRRRMAFKGTDRLGRIAKAVAEDNPDHCRLEIVENLPFREYVRRQAAADVVIDQLYSLTPATNALMAMARGQVAVSGAEPQFYEFIGEKDLLPVVNVVPDDEAIYATLLDLVLQPGLVRALGNMGREFVARHNSADVVAGRCISFWSSKL